MNLNIPELARFRRRHAVRAEEARRENERVGSEADPVAQAKLRLLRESYGDAFIASHIWTSKLMAFQKWRYLHGRLGERGDE